MRTALALAIALTACTQRSPAEEPATGAFDPAATVHRTDEAVTVEVHRREVPLAEMPIIAHTLWGLPMSGMGTVDIDLRVPVVGGRDRYSRATGSIALACPAGCTLGDDHAPLAVAGASALGFGHLALDVVDLRAEIHDGRAEITKWDLRSRDLELHARMRIDLADADLGASAIDGCVSFKATPALLATQPNMAALIATTGASPNSDGVYAIRLTGTLGAAHRLAQPCVVN